jgi:hypothetical protein
LIQDVSRIAVMSRLAEALQTERKYASDGCTSIRGVRQVPIVSVAAEILVTLRKATHPAANP